MVARRFTPLVAPVSDADLVRAMAAVGAALDGRGPPVMPVRVGNDRLDTHSSGNEPTTEPIAAAVATSGSTGEEKFALLTATALRASATAAEERLGGAGQWLLALPTGHVAGLQVLVRSVIAATIPVMVAPARPFSTETFAAAAARLGGGRRYTALVPTQLRRLVDGPRAGIDALASFDAILVGGAALDPALRVAAVELGARIVVTYGMTETCGGCVYDGQPLRGVLVRASPDAPLWLGGPTVFVGYLGRPDLTARALVSEGGVRWHVTNDLGHIGTDGHLVVDGRVDDVIVTGGEKVVPDVVEAALAAIPSVADVAVVGVADAVWGQRVVAMVVPRDVGRPPTLDEVRAATRSALPSYALPRQLCLVDEIPRLALGKPDRATMRAHLT